MDMPCIEYRDESRVVFLEAVLYEQFPNGYELPASAIAHELLHLYGAWIFIKPFSKAQKMKNAPENNFQIPLCCEHPIISMN